MTAQKDVQPQNEGEGSRTAAKQTGEQFLEMVGITQQQVDEVADLTVLNKCMILKRTEYQQRFENSEIKYFYAPNIERMHEDQWRGC